MSQINLSHIFDFCVVVNFAIIILSYPVTCHAYKPPKVVAWVCISMHPANTLTEAMLGNHVYLTLIMDLILLYPVS